MTKFVYNPKTCRFEKERFSIARSLYFICMLGLASSLFFWGISTLHSVVDEGREKKKLKAENELLDKYYPMVEQQLSQTEEQLRSLSGKDQVLKASLFNAILPSKPASFPSTLKHRATDIDDLRNEIRSLAEKAASYKNDAVFNSSYFSEQLARHGTITSNTLKNIPSLNPVAQGKLVSGFGKRINPFHKGLYNHPGIDIAATRGTPVVAAADGTVQLTQKSELLAGYGNYVDIQHGNGIISRYAHLESITVRQGQRVTKGHIIGTVGTSGGSVAPHLHYEVIRQGIEQNPLFYLLEGLRPQDYQQLLTTSRTQNQSLD